MRYVVAKVEMEIVLVFVNNNNYYSVCVCVCVDGARALVNYSGLMWRMKSCSWGVKLFDGQNVSCTLQAEYLIVIEENLVLSRIVGRIVTKYLVLTIYLDRSSKVQGHS